MAYHFRSVEDVGGFLANFPELVLADDTVSNTYYNPHLPFGRREIEDVCNLYNQTRAVDAMRQLFLRRELLNEAGNLEPGDVYPDRLGPIVTMREEELVLRRALGAAVPAAVSQQKRN